MSNHTVMVVGGGIAGLTAARELASRNVAVELVEKSCFLGGHSIGFTCKATDRCRQCGACSVEKMLGEVVQSPMIHIHLRTEVKTVTQGDTISVTLGKSDVDPGETGFLKGYSHHNSPFYVAGEKTERMPAGTVAVQELGSELAVDVNAVIVATGYEPFDPDIKSTYGYNEHRNVITGMELENILRDHSRLVRPSDGAEPDRVAFIQCVGSRDERLGNLWCSVVCCPYAMRMAGLAKYNKPDTDISIFYIDVQNTGKEFPVFHEKIQEDVTFLRCIPVDIYPSGNDGLRIQYMPEAGGNSVVMDFDMAVLSVGIMPGGDTSSLSGMFDIEMDEHGFLKQSGDGVFLAGTAKGPSTIAGSIADSEQAAYETMKYLGVIS